MKLGRKFIYNRSLSDIDIQHCQIAFCEKNFELRIFEDDSYVKCKDIIILFPSERHTEVIERVAFHVANKFVLPNMDFK